jgi:hypothetical protein
VPDPTAHSPNQPDDAGKVTPEQVQQLQAALAEQHRRLNTADPQDSDKRTAIASAIFTATEKLLAAEERLRDQIRQQERQRRNARATRGALVAAGLAAIAALPAAFGWPDRAWLLPAILLVLVALVAAADAYADEVPPEADGPHVPFVRQAHAMFLVFAAVGVAFFMTMQSTPLWGVFVVFAAVFTRPLFTALAKDVLAEVAEDRRTSTGTGHAAREGARS